VKYAEERGEYDDEAYVDALLTCTQCQQRFQGAVDVALWRAAWLHFAGRAETDAARQTALKNLGLALANAGRLDESLVIREEDLARMRRLYGPACSATIDAEEHLAINLARRGGAANDHRAIETLQRVHAVKVHNFGREHQKTLSTAGSLASILDGSGRLRESICLRRETIEAQRRILGDEQYNVLGNQMLLARSLARAGEFDEARQITNRVLPVARRVLGPDNHVTRGLQIMANES